MKITTAQTFYLDMFRDGVFRIDYKAPHALRGTPQRPRYAKRADKSPLFKGWRP